MGLIGVGSSRDSEARGLVYDGNSVELTEGLVATLSGIEAMEDLGGGELSLSIATDVRGFFSTEGSTSGGAVTERLGGDCPKTTEDTLSPSVLTTDSETTEDICLGRAKP